MKLDVNKLLYYKSTLFWLAATYSYVAMGFEVLSNLLFFLSGSFIIMYSSFTRVPVTRFIFSCKKSVKTSVLSPGAVCVIALSNLSYRIVGLRTKAYYKNLYTVSTCQKTYFCKVKKIVEKHCFEYVVKTEFFFGKKKLQ